MVPRIVLIALLLAGCGAKDDDRGATLRADVVGQQASETGAPRRVIAAATQVGLTGFDGAGQVVPGLASSWRIADNGLSVIFRLRTRTWPDGKPVTASDVVASFRRAAQPGSRNPLRELLIGFENGAAVLSGARPASALGVGAPVDNVVEVRLAGAMPHLLALLAEPEFAVTRPGIRPPPLGPFRVGDSATVPIMLTRNPAWTPSPKVTLAAIALNPVEDPGIAVARFARDRTDIVLGHGLAGFGDARLLAASNALHVEPAWAVYGYLANTARGPLADARVRRALSMAIDRDDLGSRLFGVALPPVLGLVPPLPSERVPMLPDWAIATPAARLDLARQLLAAAGFSAATPLTVTISLPVAREHAMVATEIAADWERIGVTTRTITRPDALQAQVIARGDYELALVERSGVDSPMAFVLPFTCAAKLAGYCNPAADALVNSAATTSDPVAQAATLSLAEAAMIADAPFIPLFAPVRWTLVAHRVTGWTSNAAGHHPLALLGIEGGAGPKP
nr:ABC transporter substrate-binding protein [Polymorphobacter sp.]